jgi:hypothetical protein
MHDVHIIFYEDLKFWLFALQFQPLLRLASPVQGLQSLPLGSVGRRGPMEGHSFLRESVPSCSLESYGGFLKWRYPKMEGLYIMEYPIKMGDLGVALF